MIKIAVCDDEQRVCSTLEEYIIMICKGVRMKVEIDIYNDGESIYEALREKESYHLIFLDIKLVNINGIDIGKYIREELCDNYTQIAYISGRESYAMQLFEIRPVSFMLKPISFEKVKKVINDTLSLMNVMSGKFGFKQKQDVHFVELSDIVYFKSDNRKVHIILKDGKTDFYGRLDNIYQDLPKRKFLYIHKSYIVNASYISVFEYENITLATGETLPIAQSKRKSVRMAQTNLYLECGR